jgi:hypothetical protein
MRALLRPCSCAAQQGGSGGGDEGSSGCLSPAGRISAKAGSCCSRLTAVSTRDAACCLTLAPGLQAGRQKGREARRVGL